MCILLPFHTHVAAETQAESRYKKLLPNVSCAQSEKCMRAGSGCHSKPDTMRGHSRNVHHAPHFTPTWQPWRAPNRAKKNFYNTTHTHNLTSAAYAILSPVHNPLGAASPVQQTILPPFALMRHPRRGMRHLAAIIQLLQNPAVFTKNPGNPPPLMYVVPSQRARVWPILTSHF